METVAAKLPRALVARINELISSGAFPNRSEVIRVAVREYLSAQRAEAAGKEPTEETPRVQLQATLRRLAKDSRYLNRCVALHGGRVIDSDDDFDPLVQRVLHREEQPIYVERVLEGGAPVRVRMPEGRVKAR